MVVVLLEPELRRPAITATCPHAFGLSISLASGVLSGFGIMISPAVGAVLISMSTVIVAINAKLLKF
ncbi:MAG: hypothetical protein ACOCWE_06240 [Bacillota bacterium]